MGTLELGEDVCLGRREREVGKSVREKLTLPPKAEAGDGWMFSLGLKWKQRFSEKCQRAFVRFLVRLPQRETSLWWIFFILKPLVALVPTSCAGIFTLETVWLLFMSSVCRSPSRHFC